MNRAIHGPRIALLEIRAAAAANEQTVAGEGPARIVHHEGHAAVGMPRRCAGFQIMPAERDLVAVLKIPVGALGAARRRQRDAAGGVLLQ